jgi:two-component system sensor histidine kinase/response regulator
MICRRRCRSLATVAARVPGHSVLVAADGAAAVAAFEREHFDLVLMDVQMPVLSWFEATAHIRARGRASGHSHVLIVVMTAHAMKGNRERCLEAEMDDCLSKPVQKSSPRAVRESLPGNSGFRLEDSQQARDEICVRAPEGLDPETLAEVVELFLQDCLNLMPTIDAAIQRGDSRMLQSTAHSLKGSAGNFGAKRVQDALQELEALARSGDMNPSAEVFERLKGDLRRMEAALRALLPSPALQDSPIAVRQS